MDKDSAGHTETEYSKNNSNKMGTPQREDLWFDIMNTVYPFVFTIVKIQVMFYLLLTMN